MTFAGNVAERSATAAPTRRHYARAPIQQAVIQVQVEQTAQVTLAALSQVVAGESRFTQSNALTHTDIRVDNARVQSASSDVGHEFTDPVASEALRVGLDSYSYTKLAPYTEWEDWSPRAFRLWNQYLISTRPTKIRAVSVRYVNRLELPIQGELKEYLLTAPDIAPGLPQLLSGYAMQVSIPWHLRGTRVLIRQATVLPPRPNVACVMLDIEVVRDGGSPVGLDGVVQAVEELHAIEIEVFERCITNRTREIIG